jgi:hypothetical protein
MTNSSVTVSKSTLQIENRIEMASNEGANAFMIPYSLVRFGLNKHFELRASNLLQLDDAGNLNLQRPQLGVKYALFEQGLSKTNIGVIAHFTLPFGDSNNDPTFTGWSAIALSRDIGTRHQLATNIIMNWSYSSANIEPKGRINYLSSICYNFQPVDKFSIFAEAYYTWDQDKSLSDLSTFSADFGLTYLLRDNIQLSYTFGAGTQ